MPYASMADFARTLEQRGELVRVSKPVDPYLEVGAIADRLAKTGGPAILFEKVGRSPFPVLINAFGSRSRMAAALSQPDLDAPAREIEKLLHARPGATLGDLARLVTLLPELASIPPRHAADGALPGGRAARGRHRSRPPPRPDDLAEGRRAVHHAADGDHARSRHRRAQHRHVPDAAPGPRETAMHWQIHKTGARHFRRAQGARRSGSRWRSRSAAIRRSPTPRPRRCPTGSTSGCSRASSASRRSSSSTARPSTSRCPA